MVSIFHLLVLANLVNLISCMESNREMEGYPSGYLRSCAKPSSDPVIKAKTLRKLAIVLPGDTSKKSRFNYYEMKDLGPKLNFSKPTAMYVGGYLDSPSLVIATSLGQRYSKLGYNALSLDTNYFTLMPYPLATFYMRTVGKHTAEMLANLTSQGLDPKKLELIGLSLGGQTISFIAKHYRAITGKTISRLTALDPAGPCFRDLGPQDRLDDTDADFVVTVFTNIDGFGIATPVGHVNFYVNGGEFQPGPILWIPCNVFCSHIMAFTVYLAALEHPNSFIAMQCASAQEARDRNCYDKTPLVTNILGSKTDPSKPGIYYLATDNGFPYFMGAKGLKKENEVFARQSKTVIESGPFVL